jgi:hypothetical protein
MNLESEAETMETLDYTKDSFLIDRPSSSYLGGNNNPGGV